MQDFPRNVSLECLATDTGFAFFPSLTSQKVDEYSTTYFSTFNTMFSLLILDEFMSNVVAKVLRHGYRDDDHESVIALLVFALGQLAVEGAISPPAGTNDSVRHSTIERPSGLKIFNEAHRRTDMVVTQRCLSNVQIMLLQATYFEACARHADFWSSVSAAPMACR
jgi:hypothetical protein